MRLIPKTGVETDVNATLVSGDATSSVWQAQVTIPHGLAGIQARARKP